MIAWAIAAACLMILVLVFRPAYAAERSDAYRAYMGSQAWRARSNQCIRAIRGRCALFVWLPAVEAHHLDYRNMGHEVVLWDIVPLSATAHRLAHCWLFWRGPGRPFWVLALLLSAWAWAILIRPRILVASILLVSLAIWWWWEVVSAWCGGMHQAYNWCLNGYDAMQTWIRTMDRP